MSRKKRMRNIIRSLFTLILTLLIVLLFLSIGMMNTVFHKKSFSRIMNRNDYYGEVYHSMVQRMDLVLDTAGLSPEIVPSVVTKDRVYASGQNYMQAIIMEKDPDWKLDKLHMDWDSQIRQDLAKQSIIAEDSWIENISAALTKEFKESMELPFLHSLMGYRRDVMKWMIWLVPSMIVMIGAICISLLKMHKHLHRGIRYITYGLISSSSIICFTSMYLRFKKNFWELQIEPSYYKRFILDYFKGNLTVFIYIGCIGLLVSMILISYINYLKHRLKMNGN